MRGKLHVVVGPSGSGKDTLMAGAKALLPETVFVKRTITRAADAGGEDFHSVSQNQFDELVKQSHFGVHWFANNLNYGIPADINLQLEAGKNVVFNGSRGALQDIRKCYPHVNVIWISVQTEVLAKRLFARGRECDAEILERLRRQNWTPPHDAIVIDNNGAPEAGIQALVAALTGERVSLDQVKASCVTFTAETEV